MVHYERAIKHVPEVEFHLDIAEEPGGRRFWEFDLFTKFKLLSKYLESPECHSLHDRYRIWYHLVEDYTSRDVTYRRDRPVAISGIAKMYGTLFPGERYVAGLWQSDIVPGLLWYAQGLELFGSKVGQSPDVEVSAPSWSWATAPSTYCIRNDWANKSFRSLATLKDVSFGIVDSNNPFGGILSARITIHGPVYRFSQLYHTTWRAPQSNLSAFERHLSRVIESDYGERADQFSGEGRYVALLLLQEFPSIECRVDALILKQVAGLSLSHEDEEGIAHERLGVLKLSFFRDSASASLLSIRANRKETLDDRLNPQPGPRRGKRIFCKEFFEEYHRSKWACESVVII